MADKAYFCFLLEWADMFGLLTEEQSGKLIKAMIAYEKDGIEPDFSDDAILRFAWLSNVKSKLDTLNEHYQEKVDKLSKAGKASAEKRKQKQQVLNSIADTEQSEQMLTNVNNVEHNQQMPTDVDNIDLVLDLDLVKDKKEKDKKEKADVENGFDVFWNNYPRHDSKQKAREAYCKALKKGITLDVLIAAIEKQKQTRQWQENGGQYIPYPATWLNQQRWEDEVDLNQTKNASIRKNDAQAGFMRALELQGITGVCDDG